MTFWVLCHCTFTARLIKNVVFAVRVNSQTTFYPEGKKCGRVKEKKWVKYFDDILRLFFSLANNLEIFMSLLMSTWLLLFCSFFFIHSRLWLKSFANLSATDDVEKTKTTRKQLISSGGWHQTSFSLDTKKSKQNSRENHQIYENEVCDFRVEIGNLSFEVFFWNFEGLSYWWGAGEMFTGKSKNISKTN